MKYTGAEIIIKFLEHKGIMQVTGIPGGSNLPLYNALYRSNIKHILARHEQGAGFIAQGMARSTGKAAVCFATSGPGVTNLITAIADAYLDSVPMIAITGQVSSDLIGTDAFQEIDTITMSIGITKHNYLVRSADDLTHILSEAFYLAENGRPGPVLIDVPKDVFNQKGELNILPEQIQIVKNEIGDFSKIREIADLINKSKKPIIYMGGGVNNANAGEQILALSQKNTIPVATTLMGLGNYPTKSDIYLGMLGMHGSKHTNHLLQQADLLLAFGVRFDDRATGKVKEFCTNAKIIHIDIDQSEINKIKLSHVSAQGNIKDFLVEITPFIDNNNRKKWYREIQQQKDIHNNTSATVPEKLIKQIGKVADKNTIITTDVGQHQMWVAQYYPFSKNRSFLTSGGLGTMGFGLPTAIGAALANPDKQNVCFSGDGSFYMNIQELATLSELQLDVKIIILNNGHLGLVRQQQELFYNQNYIASKFEKVFDFAEIAKNFGIDGYSISHENISDEFLWEFFEDKKPGLLNIYIPAENNVYPMVAPGAANHKMIG